MNNDKYLYIVSTVDLKEKTDEDLKKEYEVYKVKYPSWKEKSYESFYEFQEGWNWHKYSFEQEENSYFLDLDKAKASVESNFADINDGGVYNYALIKKVPLEYAYAMTRVEELYLFKYDRELDSYVEIELNKDDESKYITSVVFPLNI